MSRKPSPVASRASIFRRTDDGVPELTEKQESEKPKRIKRTFPIDPELVLLLDELQLDEFRRTGRKPELSNLVCEGIRLLGASRQHTPGNAQEVNS